MNSGDKGSASPSSRCLAMTVAPIVRAVPSRRRSESPEKNALAKARLMHENVEEEAQRRRAFDLALVKHKHEVERLRQEIAACKVLYDRKPTVLLPTTNYTSDVSSEADSTKYLYGRVDVNISRTTSHSLRNRLALTKPFIEVSKSVKCALGKIK